MSARALRKYPDAIGEHPECRPLTEDEAWMLASMIATGLKERSRNQRAALPRKCPAIQALTTQPTQ